MLPIRLINNLFATFALLAMFGAGCPGNSEDAAVASETPLHEEDAPDGLYWYPAEEGAELTYTNSGAMGEGVTQVTVTSVQSGSDGVAVSAQEVVTDAAGSTVDVERTFVTGSDGSLLIDVEAFGAMAPGMTISATGDDIRIPSIEDLEAGGAAEGTTFVEMEGSGISFRNDIAYTVAGGGIESVTVPAGTWDAYRVDVSLEVTSSMTGTFATGTSSYWFVPGFAVVREESTMEGGGMSTTITTELTESTVLPE